MPHTKFSTDYLIVGSGAVGMAFADTLLSDSDAQIILVDRHPKPGGHWNVAYPFVTLHQPSAFYGVSSKELSNGKLDQAGFNKGLGSLATGAEVSSYFDRVMVDRFLPSGRVKYFPMCEYDGGGRFHSLLSDHSFEVKKFSKIVDATYLKTTVPSTHTPSFAIEKDVWFIPLNDLPSMAEKPEEYVIVGGGKTGIDACLWLLENGVNPDRITWIMPRDAWLLDRRNTQSGIEFFSSTMGAQANQFEAIAKANTVDDLFVRLEANGILLRIDKSVKPEMFHGATISLAELEQLRRIENIIRLGRVTKISNAQIQLERGLIATNSKTVHVDCSASAISNLETKPIFEGNLITPQTVRSYQPVFSASMIAHVESTKTTQSEKNHLCQVVPLPNHDTDWVTMMIPFMTNQYNWSHDPEIKAWLSNNRLDGFSGMVRKIDKNDTEKQAILQKLRDYSMPAMTKLHQFAAEIKR